MRPIGIGKYRTTNSDHIACAGGQYVYLREAFSPLLGFLYGWTLFLVIQSGTIAAVAVGFARYSGALWPWLADDHPATDPLTMLLPAYLAIEVAARGAAPSSHNAQRPRISRHSNSGA